MYLVQFVLGLFGIVHRWFVAVVAKVSSRNQAIPACVENLD